MKSATAATATSAAPPAPDTWSTVGPLLDEFPSSVGPRRNELRAALELAAGTAGAGAAVAISAALALAAQEDQREELIAVHRDAAAQLQARTDAGVAHRRAQPARWAALDPIARALYLTADVAEAAGDWAIASYLVGAARRSHLETSEEPPARSFERTR
jgi:hypothetical protein